VLACPVDDALGFLDADDEEKELYSRVLYKDYRVYLKRVSGLRVPAGFAPERFTRAGIGKAMIWDERVPGTRHPYLLSARRRRAFRRGGGSQS
jgi:hypothetical protein